MTSPAKKILENLEVMDMDPYMDKAVASADLVGYSDLAKLIERQFGENLSNSFLDFYFSGTINETSRVLLKGFFTGRKDLLSQMCYQKLESPNDD